jgi:hypothetical protein
MWNSMPTSPLNAFTESDTSNPKVGFIFHVNVFEIGAMASPGPGSIAALVEISLMKDDDRENKTLVAEERHVAKQVN